MAKPILLVENISKQYRLGYVGTRTLAHDANRWWHRIRGKDDPYLTIGSVNDRSAKATEDYVWALKNISFKVQEGEVLGIIGKNGAGKSTLLKILSRVTGPTTGSIKSRGRIASLLEVGTGFNPELTGRENIYLNGTILGMSKKEVDAKIDEIIEFSGCEMYIDTPTKRYSSGMTVRLAFAVAAHLEPEILVIDEVLAVGDAEFQKKAIGKMQDISKGQGRTVLFVSHNMASVKTLCTRGLVIDNGRIIFQGSADEAVSKYLTNMKETDTPNRVVWDQQNAPENNGVRVEEILVFRKDKDFRKSISMDDEIKFSVKFWVDDSSRNFDVALKLKADDSTVIFSANSAKSKFANTSKSNHLEFSCIIPKNFLNEGEFILDVSIIEDNRTLVLALNDILSFLIVPKAKKMGVYMGKSQGFLKPDFEWTKSSV